jgi:hypothetical protein
MGVVWPPAKVTATEVPLTSADARHAHSAFPSQNKLRRRQRWTWRHQGHPGPAEDDRARRGVACGPRSERGGEGTAYFAAASSHLGDFLFGA